MKPLVVACVFGVGLVAANEAWAADCAPDEMALCPPCAAPPPDEDPAVTARRCKCACVPRDLGRRRRGPVRTKCGPGFRAMPVTCVRAPCPTRCVPIGSGGGGGGGGGGGSPGEVERIVSQFRAQLGQTLLQVRRQLATMLVRFRQELQQIVGELRQPPEPAAAPE